jgi:hypothetical protein
MMYSVKAPPAAAKVARSSKPSLRLMAFLSAGAAGTFRESQEMGSSAAVGVHDHQVVPVDFLIEPLTIHAHALPPRLVH